MTFRKKGKAKPTPKGTETEDQMTAQIPTEVRRIEFAGGFWPRGSWGSILMVVATPELFGVCVYGSSWGYPAGREAGFLRFGWVVLAIGMPSGSHL